DCLVIIADDQRDVGERLRHRLLRGPHANLAVKLLAHCLNNPTALAPAQATHASTAAIIGPSSRWKKAAPNRSSISNVAKLAMPLRRKSSKSPSASSTLACRAVPSNHR